MAKKYCIDCGVALGPGTNYRCMSCYRKSVEVKPRLCIDCGREITGAKRCLDCWLAYRKEKGKRNFCTDCGKAIQVGAARCRPCWKRFRKAKPNRCVECEKIISYGSTLCRECSSPKLERSWKSRSDAKYRDPEWLRAEYWDEELSSSGMAKLTGCSDSAIIRWMRRYNIPVRTQKQAANMPKCKGKHSQLMTEGWLEGRYNDIWTMEQRELRSQQTKRLWASGLFDTPEIRQKWSQNAKDLHAKGILGNWSSPTKPEIAIMDWLNKQKIRYAFDTFRLRGFRYDFHLLDYSILIEFDGAFWHKSQQAIERGQPETDAAKDKLAKEAGFALIRIPEEAAMRAGLENLLGHELRLAGVVS